MVLLSLVSQNIALNTETLEGHARKVISDSIWYTDMSFRTALLAAVTVGTIQVVSPPIGYNADLTQENSANSANSANYVDPVTATPEQIVNELIAAGLMEAS